MPKFQEAYPSLAVAPDRTGRVRTDSAAGRRMDKLVTELIVRMSKIGWKHATVINLHTWPIQVDLAYSGRHIIRGRKAKEPFVRHIIREFLIQPREMPEGERIPEAILPVEIAAEFVREYALVPIEDDQTEEGQFLKQASVGVFWYEGEDQALPEPLVVRATALQTTWHENLFEEAENLWSKTHNRREISERHKDAAKAMFDKKRLKKMPEWVYSTVEDQTPDKANQKCAGCAKEAPAEAAFCTSCLTMFNPDVVKKIRPDIYYAQRPHEVKAEK